MLSKYVLNEWIIEIPIVHYLFSVNLDFSIVLTQQNPVFKKIKSNFELQYAKKCKQSFLLQGVRDWQGISRYSFFRWCKWKYYMLNVNGNSFTSPSLKCLQIKEKLNFKSYLKASVEKISTQ